jgi:hypothetical protein
MKLIETKTLGTAAASIEFTSIPQTFTDLVAVCSLRDSTVAVVVSISVNLNSSTSGYTYRRLTGNGDSFVESSTLTSTGIALIGAASTTANTFSNQVIYFPNYTSSAPKSISADSVYENNAAQAHQSFYASLWNDTAAINAIKFNSTATLVAGSTVSLYGITKGSDGITTAS